MVAGPATVALSGERPAGVRLLVDMTANGRATGSDYVLTYTVGVRADGGVARDAALRLTSEPRTVWTKLPPGCDTGRSGDELRCTLGDVGEKPVRRSASIRVRRSAPQGSASQGWASQGSASQGSKPSGPSGRSVTVLATAEAANAAPRSARVTVELAETSITVMDGEEGAGGRPDASGAPGPGAVNPSPKGEKPSTRGPSDATGTPRPKGDASSPRDCEGGRPCVTPPSGGGKPGGAAPEAGKPSGPRPGGTGPGGGRPSGAKPKPRTPAGATHGSGAASGGPTGEETCRVGGGGARGGSCHTKTPSAGGGAKPRTKPRTSHGRGDDGPAAGGHGGTGPVYGGPAPDGEGAAGGGESCRPGEGCGTGPAPGGGAGGPGAGPPPGAEGHSVPGELPGDQPPPDQAPQDGIPPEPLPPGEPAPLPPTGEPSAPERGGVALPPPLTAPEQAVPSDGATQMTLMSPTAMSERDTTDWAIVVGAALVAEIGLLWGIACLTLWRRRIALGRVEAAAEAP